MFKPHTSICVVCGKPRLVVVKKMLCKICNEKKKQEAKKALLGGKIEATKVLRELTERKFIRRATMGRGAPLKASATTGYAGRVKKAGMWEAPDINKRKPTGELQVFKNIWNSRPHICQVTDTLIRRFDVRCFSHCAPKSVYEEGRLDEENIWLVQPEIHEEWETTDKSDPKFKLKLEHREKMKEKYQQQRIHGTGK